MTDKANASRISHARQEVLGGLSAQPHPHALTDPTTDDKNERFDRTPAEEWTHVRPLSSSADRVIKLH